MKSTGNAGGRERPLSKEQVGQVGQRRRVEGGEERTKAKRQTGSLGEGSAVSVALI
jgi:hypothetical protein